MPKPGTPDTPNMSPKAVADAVVAFEKGEKDEAVRLAWRPAWSIRSRRGAWAAFLDMLRGKG